MNKLSIKTRITVWYTGFLVIVVACVLVFLFSVGNYQAKESAKSVLADSVSEAMKDIDFDDGDLETDDVDFLSHGVYLTVYDGSQSYLAGKIPKDLPAGIAFSDKRLHTARAAENSWYVYDLSKEFKGYGTVWVRGIIPLSQAENTINMMLRLALIALPFLVLLASLGGYLITRHAFFPVRTIVRTARRIGESRDLSKRIDLPPGRDEIHALAQTFDSMLDRLEQSFEKERQFTADASHELRTPISVIIAQGEYGDAGHSTSSPQNFRSHISTSDAGKDGQAKPACGVTQPFRADRDGRFAAARNCGGKRNYYRYEHRAGSFHPW